ncbi:thymidine kinase [Lachnospiraceae bacterium PF1-21]|uniref:thymidine kinase n=1 Tax=Ohessyouella blattaphilus TaxID=2949333 RepID=A0ABT1EDF2_9FIRM|nr:ATP-binding protein [Ohessyouella blattaphilus]MCP1108731.1 ATP-binding protein [Ohessyouella blattaphilus]MCR8562125.1 ATP-binding protein [Ohessyouella blattaphilus]MDL2249367.1 ATP-binding protein [Lachnospiraceae bacterium OttesenSCG-928-J05]
MVSFLIGPKGSGKTPELVRMANEKEKTEHGSVVFIKKSHKNTKEINLNIRTICMDDYPDVHNLDRYFGFLQGIYSANTDVHQVFVDEIMKLEEIDFTTIPTLVGYIKKMSKDNNIDFHVSISATPEEIKDIDFSDCTVISF